MKTYTLFSLTSSRFLSLPLMTLTEAEKARTILAEAGKPCRIINTASE